MEDNRVNWQIDCDNIIKYKENVILSSPTGSGKTKRYEIWALNKKERPIFITSPIKSLSNQKFRDLKAQGYNVGIETGDIKYIPNDCDIICCTQEIYTNKYVDFSDSTLVVDEFSYIFDDDNRARAYIDSLYYSKAKNIIICSATLGNTQEIKEYINKVTDRDFFVYENNERLTPLEYKGEIKKYDIHNSFVVAYSRRKCIYIAHSIYEIRKRMYQSNDKNKASQIANIAKKYNLENENLIELCNLGIAYYYGTLFPKEKLFIEELFENKLIDTVVGTDSLALGVNFPIENVIFTELAKKSDGNKIISKNLFDQLSGRAGRKGYFDKGYVYYCTGFEYDYRKKEDLKQCFYNLMSMKNKNAHISLKSDIKAILSKERTIEEEAKYIVKYSTIRKNLTEEITKIKSIVEYISNIDIAKLYLSKLYANLDFSKGIYNAITPLSPKNQNKMLEQSHYLLSLQKEFDNNIKDVYFHEYSPEQNCLIFIDIINGITTTELISKYGSEFRELLLLRNYVLKLPEKYSKFLNVSLIENKIDSLDHTVLHPFDDKALITKEEKNTIIKPNLKNILNKSSTIEDEARLIIEHSKNNRNIDDEITKIKNIVELITNIDIATFYIKKKYSTLDYSRGMYNAIETAPLKIRENLKILSMDLMHLQKEFEENIADAYYHEYPPKLNCLIFIDILNDMPLKDLIRNYGNEKNKLITLKKYLDNLDEKYSKKYDINKIDQLLKHMNDNKLNFLENNMFQFDSKIRKGR